MTIPVSNGPIRPVQSVIAFSGGLDSMAAAESLRREHRCVAFHIDGGQPASRAQREACERYCKESDLPLEILELRPSLNVPIQHTMNDGLGLMCLLTLVATFSRAIGCQEIAIGVTLEQRTYFAPWLVQWKASFLACVGAEMRVAMPLGNLTKTQVVACAAELGLRASDSWSCTVQSGVPCGNCDACRDREHAETAAQAQFGRLGTYFLENLV